MLSSPLPLTLPPPRQEAGGEVTLDSLIDGQAWPPGRFLPLALALAGALERLHREHGVHRAIRPRAIRVDSAGGRVRLSAPEAAERSAPPEDFAYLAPEQTGRLHCPVDQRADLYALGVCFYELLAGQRPFAGSDPLELVHCHLAREPQPLQQRLPGLPPVLSQIVGKLLAKLPQDRYQSAAGLRADLDRCAFEWSEQQRIRPFALAGRDVSDRFQLPQRLYGRETERARLLAAFRRVVGSGRPELVFVAGYSGIGKTALVSELQRPIVEQRGRYAAGKYDQFQRGIPYATFAQALQQLVRGALAEPEPQVREWQQRLAAAVGEHGQLIAELVPQVRLLIGQPPPLLELPPDQAQHRLQRVFGRFVGAFARAEQPLVLFLDDLQWVDPASLGLLAYLASHAEIRHLLLIGAYRDNEAGPGHPLRRLQAELDERGVACERLLLEPLQAGHVRAILADTLHFGADHAAALADLVIAKTGGNPFFCLRFLTVLHQDGLIAFDADAGRWRWDVARSQARDFSDNVVELMLEGLRRLPPATQHALAVAGVLGNPFALDALAQATGWSRQDTSAHLQPALQLGLLLPQGGHCRFLHDRVQEAAVLSVPAGERDALHLRIGRLLRDGTPAAQRDEQLFATVLHLNRGAALIGDAAERRQLALLDQRAAAKARIGASFAAAAGYLAAGIGLLDADAWRSDYELAFEMHLARAQNECLAGGLASAEQLLDGLLAAAHDTLDRARVHLARIAVLMIRGDNHAACATARHSLGELGFEVPLQPTPAQIAAMQAEVQALLGERPIDSLLELPRIAEPRLQMAIRLLMAITTATYFRDPAGWAQHVPRMMALTLRHGVCEETVMVYTFFGFQTAAASEHFVDGLRYCELACRLADRLGVQHLRGNMLYHRALTSLWLSPLARVLAALRESMPAAIEVGDLLIASLASHHVALLSLYRGDPLAQVAEQVAATQELAHRGQYALVERLMQPTRQLLRTLRGQTTQAGAFGEPDAEERAFEAGLAHEPVTMIACYHHLARLTLACIAGDVAAARSAADCVEQRLWSVTGISSHMLCLHYGALARAGFCATLAGEPLQAELAILHAQQRQLAVWAEHNPATFGHSPLLIGAEIARLESRPLQAMRLYRQAIEACRAQGYLQHEALACERAAQFYRDAEADDVAGFYLLQAHSAYARWGAAAKLEQLETRHALLRLPGRRRGDRLAATAASQASADPAARDELLRGLLQAMLEQAGAQFVALALQRESGLQSGLQLVATARVQAQSIRITLAPAETIDAGAVPAALLAYVQRSGEPVLIDDARQTHPFAHDAWFQTHHPRSMLALPILRRGAAAGVLCLMHDGLAGLFTAQHLALLERLAERAALALDD